MSPAEFRVQGSGFRVYSFASRISHLWSGVCGFMFGDLIWSLFFWNLRFGGFSAFWRERNRNSPF